jgi:adenylate cyclase
MDRRLTAILAADVAGYSRLMGEDETGTLQALKQFRQGLFEPAVSNHQGEIVKRMGDGWLVTFPSVVDAVNCALAIHNGLVGDAVIRLRTGVHIGDIVHEDEDIYGDGVNIAARLQDLAKPGAVLVSDIVRQQIGSKVALQTRKLGARKLKNIAEAVTVHQIFGDEMDSEPVLTLPDNPSIAVLPFANMSGDEEQEYFADGITEDIITSLSKIRSLFVIARNSSFTYKGKNVDVRQVSKNLGVRYVLEGSVRKAGGRVRITGQLIDAITGNHIWADRFDGVMDDIFDLQDQVTAQVTAAVAPSIRTAEIARIRRKGASDLTAYDLYLQALAKTNNLASDEAFDLLAEARRLAPDFAPAYGLEAWCRTLWLYSTNDLDFAVNGKAACDLARAAMNLGDDDPELRGQIGYTLAFFEENADLGREMVRQSLETAPCLAWLWSSHGYLEAFFGDCDEAVAAFETAQRLDPRDPLAFRAKCGIAVASIMLENYEDALRSARDALEMSPENLAALRFAAGAAAMAGHDQLAREFTAELMRVYPEFSCSQWYRNMPIRNAKRLDVIIEALKRAGIPD